MVFSSGGDSRGGAASGGFLEALFPVNRPQQLSTGFGQPDLDNGRQVRSEEPMAKVVSVLVKRESLDMLARVTVSKAKV